MNKLNEPPNQHDIALFVAVKDVQDEIFSHCYTDPQYGTDKPYLKDRRGFPPDIYYPQTQGLFMEFRYEQPCDLWTPWGLINFAQHGYGDWGLILPLLKESLGLSLYRGYYVDESSDDLDMRGPVYSIHHVKGKALPKPLVVDERFLYQPYYCNKSWEEMEKEYEKLNSTPKTYQDLFNFIQYAERDKHGIHYVDNHNALRIMNNRFTGNMCRQVNVLTRDPASRQFVSIGNILFGIDGSVDVVPVIKGNAHYQNATVLSTDCIIDDTYPLHHLHAKQIKDIITKVL